LRSDLPRNRPPFLGHYGELHHAEFSPLLNEMLVQHSTVCSVVTADATSELSPGTFGPDLVFSKIQIGRFNALLVHHILP